MTGGALKIWQDKNSKIFIVIIAILIIAGGLYISLRNVSEIDSFLAQYPKLDIFFQTNEIPAKSLILMIGDGMGSEHRLAAQYVTAGRFGDLEMDSLGVSGNLRTGSADNAITDSAASGTAMSTGYKTNNGVIGMDRNLNDLVSIFEVAKDLGKSIGLVTTTQVTHATPASFVAHVESRYQMNDIAEQFLSAGVNVILGGGEDYFIPDYETGCYPEPGERIDGRNLIDEAVASGYVYVCDVGSLEGITLSSPTHVLGLFADEGLVDLHSPSLAVMTEVALSLLSKDPDGFILIVEGGQIDWAAHNNDAAKVISETIAFDDTVKVARKFLASSPETLLIVTADHETGGMSLSLTETGLPGEDGPFSILDGGMFYVNWTTTGHTAVKVPVTAIGPFSAKLKGNHENTFIHDLILKALCFRGDRASSVSPACELLN